MANLNFFLFNLNTIDNSTRKGINYAIERDGLQKILKEQGKVTSSFFPSIFNKISYPVEILKYSPKKAKKLLIKKRKIKLVCFEDILSRSISEYVAENLKKYLIDVEIESVTFPVLIDRLTTGKYDIY